MADRGLEKVDIAAFGVSKVDVLQLQQRQFVFFIEAHDPQGVQTIHHCCSPTTKGGFKPTGDRPQFILPPCLLLVASPRMQKGIADLRQPLLSYGLLPQSLLDWLVLYPGYFSSCSGLGQV